MFFGKRPNYQILLTEVRQQMAIWLGYLISISVAHDNGEAVVIGGGVAKQVDDGAHPLDPVERSDRGTHHLSASRGRGNKEREGKKMM